MTEKTKGKGKVQRDFLVKYADSFENSFDEGSYASGSWAVDTQALLDAYTLKSLMFTEPWVFIIVDLLSNELSGVNPTVMYKEIVDGEVKTEVAEDHPVQKLLDAPNDYEDGTSFLYKWCLEYSLMGNAVISKAEKGQLEVLPTETISILFNEKTLKPEVYICDDIQTKTRTNIPVRDIMHVRRTNPSSRYWGLSPFVPGRACVLFDRYSNEYLNNFYKKGASPGIILESSDDLTELQQNQLLRSFTQAHTGRQNMRRPLLLPPGVKASPFDTKIVDQGLVDLVNQNRETILNLLRVPKHAVGLQESGSLGSEEHKASLRYLWSATIMPMVKRFEQALNRFLYPALGDDYIIEFDVSAIQLLADDRQSKADLAEAMLKTHTVNEVRAEVYDLEAVPGGDQVTTITDMAGNLALSQQPAPAEPPAFEEGKAFTSDTPKRYTHLDFTPTEAVALNAKRGLEMRREFGRGGTPTGIARARDLAARKVVSSDTVRRMHRFYLRHAVTRDSQLPGGEPGNGQIAWLMWGGDAGQRWVASLWDKMDQADSQVGDAQEWSSYLKEPDDDVGVSLDFDRNAKTMHHLKTKFPERIEKALKNIEDTEAKGIKEMRRFYADVLLQFLEKAIPVIKKTVTEKALKEATVDQEVLRKRLNAAFKTLGRSVTSEQVERLSGIVDTGYDTQLELVFNQDAADAIEALKARDADGRLNILEARAIETFQNISRTTTEQIVGLVAKGVEAQDTTAEIAKRIRDDYPEITFRRSDTIARTEALTAFSIGQHGAMENTMEVLPETKKVWISARDERVRGNPGGLYPDAKDNHWELSGEVVGGDKEFSNGLRFPRDPEGKGYQTINCRCTMAPVMPEDLEPDAVRLDDLTNE